MNDTMVKYSGIKLAPLRVSEWELLLGIHELEELGLGTCNVLPKMLRIQIKGGYKQV